MLCLLLNSLWEDKRPLLWQPWWLLPCHKRARDVFEEIVLRGAWVAQSVKRLTSARSRSRGPWVRAPRRALGWWLGAWSLFPILCLPLSLPLPRSCSVSLCPKNKRWKKIFFKTIGGKKSMCILKRKDFSQNRHPFNNRYSRMSHREGWFLCMYKCILLWILYLACQIPEIRNFWSSSSLNMNYCCVVLGDLVICSLAL